MTPQTQSLIGPHAYLAEIAKLPRKDRMMIREGLDALCTPSPRVVVHHKGSDETVEWDLALHGPRHQQEFDSNLTPSLVDYIETMEYVNANPGETSTHELRAGFLGAFARGLVTGSRVTYAPGSASSVTHPSAGGATVAQGALHGPSGILAHVPTGYARLLALYDKPSLLLDSEQLANMLFDGRSALHVADTVADFTGGLRLGIQRNDAWTLAEGIPRSYGIGIQQHGQDLNVILMVSDASLRYAHGRTVVARSPHAD